MDTGGIRYPCTDTRFWLVSADRGILYTAVSETPVSEDTGKVKVSADRRKYPNLGYFIQTRVVVVGVGRGAWLE